MHGRLYNLSQLNQTRELFGARLKHMIYSNHGSNKREFALISLAARHAAALSRNLLKYLIPNALFSIVLNNRMTSLCLPRLKFGKIQKETQTA
jgi:hypothetical protein